MIAGKNLLAFKRGEESQKPVSRKCFAFVQTYDRGWGLAASGGAGAPLDFDPGRRAVYDQFPTGQGPIG
ncbi:MAG TPA: hypothetical protein VGC99_23105 [Candidatus Tectomicrobia bacterium]